MKGEDPVEVGTCLFSPIELMASTLENFTRRFQPTNLFIMLSWVVDSGYRKAVERDAASGRSRSLQQIAESQIIW
jgi:hypothetical protein